MIEDIDLIRDNQAPTDILLDQEYRGAAIPNVAHRSVGLITGAPLWQVLRPSHCSLRAKVYFCVKRLERQ